MSDVLTKNYDPNDEMYMINLYNRVCKLERIHQLSVSFDWTMESRIRALEKKLKIKTTRDSWEERISHLESVSNR